MWFKTEPELTKESDETKQSKAKVFPVINQALHHEDVLVEWR
jgi:hypothetical protein